MRAGFLFFIMVLSAYAVELSDWREALNRDLYKGQTEVATTVGVADIITSTQVVKLAYLHEGSTALAEAQKLGTATHKLAILTVIIDGPADDWTTLDALKNQAKEKQVEVVLANSQLNLERVRATAKVPAKAATPTTATSASTTSSAATVGQKFWLSGSGKRHNEKCRYYGTGKGKPCGTVDGKACKICGG